MVLLQGKKTFHCKTLYDRLLAMANGKQALIAVCNKLLKQVFVPIAIGKRTTVCISPITV